MQRHPADPPDLSDLSDLSGLAGLVRAAEPRLGPVRLVVVDGPAGSGKSTLATRLASALDDAAVVHLDDLYEGWSGLDEAVWRRLGGVLDPLARARAGRFTRYDWDAGRFAEEHVVPVPAVLVVEGVGAAARPVDPHASVRVWVEAARDVRLARGLARDGVALQQEWQRFADREDAHFTADGTRGRADVVLSGEVWLPDGPAEG